ncbi:methylesterase 1-like isoform X2 [Benincasa hispida]|uniref:methylesterase 1-like isoform X2 n=1 Tax=Benincasa hispida TaxID=102211 RepID=UPI001901AB75|nr:methylesterase 1-like isoform X2 [Benincasa hispida]
MEQRHFVLVHGACHGAWCWYKIQPLLEAAGHRVTVLDMAGAGVHRKAIQEVKSLEEYSEPLLKTMACVGPNEKVILVGHSFGGMSLALAMEKFPHNISASVFLTALAPDTHHHPSYVSEQDLALGKSLVRPGSLLVEELAKAEKFTEENYGSVKKVYVICGEDKTIPKHFQKWMIQNYGIQNVMEIEGADHMPMFSKPLQVLQCLLQVAHNFT